MKYIFSILFICFIHFGLSAERIEIYGVELQNTPSSQLLHEFHIVKLHSDIPKMDSLFLILSELEGLNEKQEAIRYCMAGWYYIYIDFYDKAAESFANSIRLGEKLELRLLELYGRAGMATVEYSYKNLDGAIAGFQEVLNETLEEDWKLMGSTHANIAPLLFEKSWLHESDPLVKDSLNKLSDEHYRLAINILEKNEGLLELCRVYSIYARSLLRDKKYGETKHYLIKASEACLKVDNQYRYHFNLIKWAEYHSEMKEYEQAKDSLRRALAYFNHVGNKEMEHYSINELGYAHARTSEYDSAFIYAMKLDRLKRSMNLDKMGRQSRQYKVELEVYDKENKIKEQAREIEVQTYENEIAEAKQKRWLIGGVSAVIIVLLLSFIYVQFTKQRTKAEKAELIIKEREQAFRSVIKGQEAERKRIAQELHDGIGQQLSGIKMALQNLTVNIKEKEGESQKTLKSIINLVGNSSSEVRQLAHQMLPQVLEEKGLDEALKDLIQSTYQSTRIKFNYENQLKSISLGKDWKLTIYRSIQELINNSIKHAEATEIDIYLYDSKSQIFVAFSDNGKGIGSSIKLGLGLNGIKHRVENLKGGFTIDTTAEKGFNAILKIPKA